MKRRGIAAFGAALAVLCLLAAGSGAVSPAKAESTATASQQSALPGLTKHRIRPGDTLEGVLSSNGASRVDAGLVAKALRKIFDPRDLKPGQTLSIRLERDASGALTLSGASLQLAKGRYAEVTRAKSGAYLAKRTKQALAAPVVARAEPKAAKPTPVVAGAQPKATKPAPVKSAAAKAATPAPKKAASSSGERVVQIKRGDTLVSLLRAARIDADDANRAVKALGDQVDLRSLHAGQEVVITVGPPQGKRHALDRLAVAIKDGAYAEVVRRADGSFVSPERVGTAVASAAAPRAEKSIETDKPAVAEAVPKSAEEVKSADAAKSRADDAAMAGEEIVTLGKGGTLHSLLKALGYRTTDVAAIAKATALSIDPTALRWGQKIRLAFHLAPDGSKQLDGLGIERKDQPALVVVRRDDGEFGPVLTAAESAGAASTSVDEPSDDETSDSHTVYIEEQAAPRDAAYRVVVEPGDSLMNLLLREGMDANEIDQAVRSLRKVYNPRRLREGQELALLTDVDSSGGLHLAALSIALSERRHVEVRRSSGNGFKARFLPTPSFADRLPPEGVGAAYAGYPALSSSDPALTAMNLRARGADGEDGDEPEGWSVLSWLGRFGDLIGRTGSAEASVIDLSPDPRRNRALDLDESSAPLDEDPSFRKVRIAKGDTLVSALSRGGVDSAEAEAVVAAFKKVHSPRRLQVGQTLSLAFDAIELPPTREKVAGAKKEADAGYALRRISLSIGPDRDIVVERAPGERFSAREIERPLVRSVYKATGEISSSFYEAALAAGLSMDVLAQLVQLFSYDVDFQRGLQPGDRFEVLFERTENDRGDAVEQGTVLFAALTVSGEELSFYRFEAPDGPADYFDRNGNSVRKALLRTPVDGARISSSFGMRKHPILGYSKKHKGVDFSSPPGTPVYAAGDGVIEKIGWFSSYGKYVRVKHNDTFKTAYAHLKGYARGMKIGTKVRQGQVIGYVGSTGRSTGPHLHYEVMKHAKQVNPNDNKLPIGKQLAGKQLARFKTEIDSYRTMFAQAGTLGAKLARNALNGN